MDSSDQTPEAYLKGEIEFGDLVFEVNPSVLIPRIETLQSVKEVLSHASPTDTIVDLGTGSGIIAITLAKKLPEANIHAVDVSEEALEVARRNAQKHNASIHFHKGNLLEPISEAVDILVANLPYLPTSRIPELQSSVKHYEPHLALDGGKDGFDIYRQLFAQVQALSDKPKLMVIEIDDDHGPLALAEAAKFFPDTKATAYKDFANLDRILKIEF